MNSKPNSCPQCQSQKIYDEGIAWACPDCGWEGPLENLGGPDTQKEIIRDAFGNELADGDSISVIKDLKVKGASGVIKVGTKVKNIRLIDGDHNIECKIPGIGPMQLKSEFVKKV